MVDGSIEVAGRRSEPTIDKYIQERTKHLNSLLSNEVIYYEGGRVVIRATD